MHLFASHLIAALLSSASAHPAPSSPAPSAAPATSTLQSWQNDVVYQVYPQSFADSNGDGFGDLRGMLSKVDYLHDLGVDVVWFTPIYASSHYDGGYDVSDYLAIDPQYGTMADWYALRDALHARGMKIVMDLVVNHSSDAHPWYRQEVQLKRLQHQLTELIRLAPEEEGETILNLLADPESRGDQPLSANVEAANRAIDRYLQVDNAAAEAAGYPCQASQLATLARALSPCAEPSRRCVGIDLPFDDFYIWRDAPNNWTSFFSGSAWHAVEGTGGHTLSMFSEHQVDLNWRNPRVRSSMAHVVATWEARGLDGIRIDALATLSKNPTFPNALPNENYATGAGNRFYTNLPAVHRFLRELAHVYRPGFRSIGEVAFIHSDGAVAYSGADRDEVKEVFVFDHIVGDNDGSKFRPRPFDVLAFKREFALQQRLIHDRAWLGNYLENHDQLRVTSRFGDVGAFRAQSAKLFAALLMTLEGTPYIYQGQEIGMTNLPPSMTQRIEDVQDIEARNYYYAQVKAGEAAGPLLKNVIRRCRDNMRSAMQWSSAPGAGFSSHPGVVRVNPNTTTINVDAALADPNSIWHAYHDLIAARRTHPSWVHGRMVDLLPEHPKVFAYARVKDDEKTLVLLNISDEVQAIDVPTVGLPNGPLQEAFSNYPQVPALQSALTLRPWEARIVVGRRQPPQPVKESTPQAEGCSLAAPSSCSKPLDPGADEDALVP